MNCVTLIPHKIIEEEKRKKYSRLIEIPTERKKTRHDINKSRQRLGARLCL